MIGDLADGELLPGAGLPLRRRRRAAADRRVLGEDDWWRRLPVRPKPAGAAPRPDEVAGLRDATGSARDARRT